MSQPAVFPHVIVCSRIGSNMSDSVPFSLVIPTLAIPNCIGHCREGALGTSVLWDWRHFHYQLHSSEMRSWLADSGRSVLDKVVRDWALPTAAIVRPTKGVALEDSAGPAPKRTSLMVSTAAVCALLLHQACLGSNPAARRAQCVRMASDWLGMSAKGFAHLAEHRVAVRVDFGDDKAELQVDANSDTLLGMQAILERAPALAGRWRARSPKLGRLASAIEQPSVADFAMFAADLPQSVKAQWPWLSNLAADVLAVAAMGVEAFVMKSYLPENGRLRAIEPLRAQFRARNLDPINKELLGAKMDTVGGSAAHTSRAVAGTSWHANAWRQATLHLYDQKTRNAFKGCLHISLSLDPGAYAGEQTSVGCIHSIQTGVLAVLPVKAACAISPRVSGASLPP